MYSFGTIVLIPFPFTDLSATKVRPALIISKTQKDTEDVIVAFITSRTARFRKTSVRFPILSKVSYFSQTGLKVDSSVCLDKIATLHKGLILGELGSLPKAVLKSMGKSWKVVFGF